MASAQVACPAPLGPSVTIAGPADAQGSSGAMALAQQLVDATADPSTPVTYVPLTACAAIEALMSRTPLSVSGISLSSVGAPVPCIGMGAPPDLVISEVFADTCASALGVPTPQALNAGRSAMKDFWGPVEVTTFAVPRASTERALSADAAYVIFGFGGAGSVVSPWSDPGSIFAPNRQSSLLDLVATAIGLAPSHWATAAHSTVTATSAALAALQGAAVPGAAIAVLPSQVVEANADSLQPLAYEHTGQSCGYLPNSDGQHFDEVNVREGRYALWGPLHIFIAVDVTGNIVDHAGNRDALLSQMGDLLTAIGPTPTQAGEADAAAIADAMSSVADGATDGSAPSTSAQQTFIEGVAQAGMIPWCAMNVYRATEMGAESSYQPARPCRCSFENLVGAPTSPCMACRTDADCSDAEPVCRFGYCEVQ
jgi:hypothetical protein